MPRSPGTASGFPDLSGKLDGGELTGLLEARNNDGTTLVSTQFKLAGADLGQVLDGSGLTGSGDITASLSASGKSVEALVASLSGSGTATRQGCAHSGHQPGCVPGAAGRRGPGRPRDRCGAHGGLRAGDRVGRNLRRAAGANRLHRCGRRAARAARHARCRHGVGVGRAQDRVRHRCGGCGRHGHLCGRRRRGGRIGSGRALHHRGPAWRDVGQIRHRAAGAVPDPARTGARAGAGRGAAIGACSKSSGCGARCATTRRCSSSATRPPSSRARLRKRRRRPRPSARRRRRPGRRPRRKREPGRKPSSARPRRSARLKKRRRPRRKNGARQRRKQTAQGRGGGADGRRGQAPGRSRGAAQGQRRRPSAKAATDATGRRGCKGSGRREEASAQGRRGHQACRGGACKADEASGSTIERVPLPAPRDAPQSNGALRRKFDPRRDRRIPEIARELTRCRAVRLSRMQGCRGFETTEPGPTQLKSLVERFSASSST